LNKGGINLITTIDTLQPNTTRSVHTPKAGWLDTPIRKLFQKPEQILAGLVNPGAVALDLGCGPGTFNKPVDFALAFWMLQEAPDMPAFLSEVHGLLKPGGKFLLVEPVGVVDTARYQAEVEQARLAGLRPVSDRKVSLSRAMIFA
jgi:hypothetical protein